MQNDPGSVLRPTSSAQPRLSFVSCARNDNYGGNFIWRLETALNFLGDNLDKLDRLEDVEVVVTDWGSENPLSTVLSLNKAASLITRFVMVSPSLAKGVEPVSEFLWVVAENAAIRRSRGDYVAEIWGDILLTEDFLGQLFRILDGYQEIDVPIDCSMVIGRRRNVPSAYVKRCPSLRELDWIVSRLGGLMPYDLPLAVRDLPFYYFPAGFLMMPRRLWEECGGYDESMLHYGFTDTDLIRRIASKYSCMYLDKVGLTVFHLDHQRSLSGVRTDRKINQERLENSYCPNIDTWGLAGYVLEESSCSVEVNSKNYSRRGPEHGGVLTWDLLLTVINVLAAWLLSLISIWPRRASMLWAEVRRHPVRLWPSVFPKLWTGWRSRQRMRRHFLHQKTE